MGTTDKFTVATNASITTSYAGFATPELGVAGSDSITLILTGITTIAQLSMKFSDGDNDLLKVDNGTTALDEVVHTVASSGSSVAIRIDTRSLYSMKIHFKGDVSGSISNIEVRYEGTQTVTPRIKS